ncbi:MAG TPA: hypothetical protein VLX91_07275 [Candidatus Acidoferrales bacterium]|nr:hypothetical protein [Candidatus Acidoferrales bacterium]
MNLTKSKSVFIVLVLMMFSAIWGCTSSDIVTRQDYAATFAAPGNSSSPYLKVHMMNGDVYVLTKWEKEDDSKMMTGIGKHYDLNRNPMPDSSFSIPFDSIAVFETNTVNSSPAIAAMAIVTGISVAMTIYCAANPKACFGSCPTFYAWDGKRMRVQAEGFSASVLPAWEENDIDALYLAKPTNKNFEVILTNEAMETHVIRYAHLLIAHRSMGKRVFVTPSGEFFEADTIIKPISAIAPEGSCLDKLSAADDVERFSTADSNNLASKEEIELTFDSVPKGNLGLALGYRQTLLTTYLFYQALAYMGSSAGQWAAAVQLETGTYANMLKRLFWAPVSTIEVMTQDKNGNWQRSGEFSEIGPIATNVELIQLPQPASSTMKIKLRMTRGMWRLDYAALVHLSKKVEPLKVQPSVVVRGDTMIDEKARMSLAGEATPLVTMPGDRYSIIYKLPDDYENYEVFIESKGYYLEWIRKEWIAEENPNMTMMMFANPSQYLKVLAPQFKRIEPQMEKDFWRSKYVQH